MDKNRFETQKEVVNLDPTVHNIQALFTVEDLKWLMEQAEKVKELKEQVRRYQMMYDNTGAMFNRMTMKEKIERYEKALKEITESAEDTSCNEIALKYEVIADKALNN